MRRQPVPRDKRGPQSLVKGLIWVSTAPDEQFSWHPAQSKPRPIIPSARLPCGRRAFA